jgi:methyl-accepting chemotaxis protein
MKFSTRLMLSAVVPALVFFVALGVSLFGLFRTERDFAMLMASEQKLATGFADLYGHGLQAGQALRNIVLDPANPKAFDNLKAARTAYDKTYDEMKTVAAGTALAAPIQALAALRDAQSAAQDEVLALAKQDQAAAIAALNSKETPAWRELRAQLLKLGDTARTSAAQAHEETRRTTARTKTLALVLAALAALASGAFLVLSQRTVRRELGGEPQQAGAALRLIASGDLSVDIPAGRHDHSLMAELSRMQQALRQLVGRVRESSESILVASSEVAVGSMDLSARTEQAASNLQETAASMEQMTNSVRGTADAAATANQLVNSATDTASKGGQVVADVVKTMDDISAGSRRIGDIIGVIDGIAFQTNILALNAAVEAARAGEQGRGFAVVAAEVRSLAQRSAEAAKEIKSLITSSVERVESGSALVGAAGQTMNEIVASVQRVNGVIGEITSASGEQSSGIQQIGAAIGNLDQMTQQNAALVEESAAAAESLKEQARSLAAVVSAFRLKNDGTGRAPALA